MYDDEWRERLERAIAASGKSKRAVSLDSGNGPGYVHSILTEGKDPTVQKLIAVCSAADASAAFIIHGINVTRKESDLLRLIQTNPEKMDAILSLLDT